MSILRIGFLLAVLAFPVPAAAQLIYVVERVAPFGPDDGTLDLHVINSATGHLVASLNLGDTATAVVASPDGRTVYAATVSDLIVLDALTLTERHRIPIGRTVVDLALSVDGTRLHVAQGVAPRQFPQNYRVLTFDTATMQTVGADVPLSQGPTHIALSGDGTRLFAISLDVLFAIDTGARVVLESRSIGVGDARDLVAHPGLSLLYVAAGGSSLPDRDRIIAYDTSTLDEIQTLVLPDFRLQYGQVFASTAIGQLAISPSGDRLYVPRSSYAIPGSSSFLKQEVVQVIRTSPLALAETVTPANGDALVGGLAAALLPDGSQLFTMGRAASRIDAATLAVTPAGSGIEPGQIAAAPAPPCWFEVWPQQLYPRTNGGQMTIPIAAAAGCEWNATTDVPWIGVITASGVGPGHTTLQISSSTEPRTGTVRISGQTIVVSQIVASLFVDTPAPGSELTLPFDFSGWAADRRAAGPFPDVVAHTGIDLVELWVQPDGGMPALLRSLPYGLPRLDVGAIHGGTYTNSGFAARIGRLAAGPQTLIVRARSRYDAMVHEVSVPITVRRQPLVAIDAPAAGAVVQQPFELSGWAADMTAPTGMGVDAVHLWAYPIAGGLPIFAGAATYGIDRGDLQTFFGFGPITAGYRLSVSGLPAGTYTLVAFAHSTETNAFEASASVVVTVSGPPPGAPFGVIDTPVSNATVAGAIGITGWALDDTGVTRVVISRAPMGSETGDVYVGDATFVAGVRPDITAAYPAYPQNDRGWGLMVLTNMLPGGGNGTVTFHADAYDAAGNMVRLGSRMVNAANAASDLPFGTLDTPGPGAVVSGTIPVFGWALSPSSLIPLDGSTIDVLIDDVVVGRPTYNLCRGTVGTSPPVGTCNDDIATLFGAAYPNIAQGSGAIGVYMLDTTTLTNGLHTIAWRVTDGNGRTQGLGSRYFVVQNP